MLSRPVPIPHPGLVGRLFRRAAACWVLLHLASGSPYAHALKACGPDTWFAEPDKSVSDWRRLASWIAVAELVQLDEKQATAPNCMAKDASQCAKIDRSTATFRLQSWKKGGKEMLRPGASLSLSAAFCAQQPPREIGSVYELYGQTPETYIFYRKAAK